MSNKKLPADFNYLPEMYNDQYFPDFLVDKLKETLKQLVDFIENGNHSTEEVQAELDKMVSKINYLQDDFTENESEIETGARESIAETVERILQHFEIHIDIEEALRERDW